MKKTKIKLMLTAIAVSCMFLFLAQTAMATVTDVSGGTSAPQVSGTSGGTSSGTSAGTSTSTGGKTPQTGAEMVLIAIAGAGLLGAGYFMVRKSKAQA